MRVVASVLGSVAFHAALVLALAAGMASLGPVELASLDLSAIEFSFSETAGEQESSAVSAKEEMPANPSPVMELPAPEAGEPASVPPPVPVRSAGIVPEEDFPPMETPPAIGEHAHPAAEDAPAADHAKIDAPASLSSAISPAYPRQARQRGESGDVVLEILVGKDGRAISVSVASSSGWRDLDDAAVAAARKARFNPAKSGGEPAESLVRLPLSFVLK